MGMAVARREQPGPVAQITEGLGGIGHGLSNIGVGLAGAIGQTVGGVVDVLPGREGQRLKQEDRIRAEERERVRLELLQSLEDQKMSDAQRALVLEKQRKLQEEERLLEEQRRREEEEVLAREEAERRSKRLEEDRWQLELEWWRDASLFCPILAWKVSLEQEVHQIAIEQTEKEWILHVDNEVAHTTQRGKSTVISFFIQSLDRSKKLGAALTIKKTGLTRTWTYDLNVNARQVKLYWSKKAGNTKGAAAIEVC